MFFKSVIFSTIFMYVMQPYKANWIIKTLQFPIPYIEWNPSVSFFPQLNVVVGGSVLVSNPNLLGSHVFDGMFDVYLQLSQYHVLRIGKAETAHETRLRGRGDTEVSSRVILENVTPSIFLQWLQELWHGSGVFNIVAVGRAHVKTLLNFSVAVKCQQALVLRPWRWSLKLPYVQIEDSKNQLRSQQCEYLYKIVVPNGATHLEPVPRAYVYDKLGGKLSLFLRI
jgi:hypothetical protein